MHPKRYLTSIGYSGPATPTFAVLDYIHQAHLQHIPFENLSIHLGQPIVLDEQKLYNKMVGTGRGGFCYELNGLFAWLLRSLGYEVTYLSAEVMGGNGNYGPAYDHLTLRVLAGGGPYLADVGFGRCFRRPLRLDTTKAQHDGFAAYRLVPAGEFLVLEQKEAGGEWAPQYRFQLIPETFAAFSGMCRFHQTSPDSSFTQRTICTRATPTGRVTLANNRFILTENGRRDEMIIPDKLTYGRLLKKWFNIEIDIEQIGKFVLPG